MEDASMFKKDVQNRYDQLSNHFRKWETIKDLVDQNIDIMLNYRQSGHPGGSRSKVHTVLALMFCGEMRWDIRHPEKRFGDRFILSAGHTVPLIYATFAVLNEAMRIKYQQTRNKKYLLPNEKQFVLSWRDLADLRRNGGLSGHAEMEGKTLFLKWNTGPSGHGLPPSVGQALAIRRAKAEGVKVLVIEGEGGLTPGASHESKNSAWALGLDNLFYFIDWNDFGIDDRPTSSVVPGTPEQWFKAYSWRVFGTERGSDWESLTRTMLEMFHSDNTAKVPSAMWFKTRKGREYLVYDNKSHGTPHPMNSELFWKTKKPFADKYGVEFDGFGQPAPEGERAIRQQCLNNLEKVIDVLRQDQSLVDYIADTLVEIGESVPQKISSFCLPVDKNPLKDPRLYDVKSYPSELFVEPGTDIANRAAFAKFGAWINTYSREKYNRPIFIACSADLADSTNISGFAKDWEGVAGYGWYERDRNPDGVLLPQEITEFTNAGIMAGIASVNFAENPFDEYNGFYTACSTYGSFSYLKYGEMRLFSQLTQNCQLGTGKVIWVAGHSGPETAEDARTHFGIFSPVVTQLFPRGSVVNVYPWEHNEVPVVLGAALATERHIIALHLTRPKITVPDREALGIDSHFEAARGAYLIRPYRDGKPRMGTLVVQGTSTTANIVKILPELDRAGLNVKIVAAISPELFRMQSAEWRERVLSELDWIDSTVISNMCIRSMFDWLSSSVAMEYAMTSDFDDRWRTGGSVEEVVAEAHLSPEWLLKGIERFARERKERLNRIRQSADRALNG
jgi:transketolase